MSSRLALLLLFVVSCSDSAQQTISPPGQPDATPRLAIPETIPDGGSDEPDVRVITQWDAAPPDAAPDAGPPVVCDTEGARETCQIEGLLGPCAEGERICRVTYWSQCVPVNFSRREVCDASIMTVMGE